MKQIRLLSLWLTIAVLFSTTLLVPTAHARLSQEDLKHALQSTVLILTLDDDLNVIARGSGSTVDPRGLILTNFHVVGDTDRETLANADGLVAVAITRDVRRAAVPTYLGRVIRGDPVLDLALVQLVADIKGNPLQGCQTLPAYLVGDSDLLEVGQDFSIVGFPGIGGESVTFTTGTVSGFLAEGTLIKTDAEINPGNSGGSAVADDGSLVGVPTFTREGEGGRQGKFGLVRPINLAVRMVENLPEVGVAGCDGSRTQGRNKNTKPKPQGRPGTTSSAFIGFTVDPDDESMSDQQPSGVEKLVAHFSYSGVTASTPLAAQWRYEGDIIEGTELFFEEWPLDAGSGQAFVNLNGGRDGLPDGTYTVEIQVGNQPVLSADAVVGAASSGGEAESVTMIGRVLSADSGKPLRKAMFIVLTPGVTWDDFDKNNRSHVYDVAFTASNGVFEMNQPVELDTAYSVAVLMDGFQPLLVDDFIPREFYESGNFLDLGDIGLKSSK